MLVALTIAILLQIALGDRYVSPRSINVLAKIENPCFSTSFELIEYSTQEIGLIVNPPGFTNSDNDLNVVPIPNSSVADADVVLVDFTRTDDRAIRVLQGLNTIRVLDVSGTRITDDSAETIASLKELEILDLSDTNVTEKTLIALLALPKLQWLSISGTPIALEDICQFVQKSKVEFFFCNGLRSGSGQVVLQSESIRVLDISFNKDIQFILKRLPKLNQVFLSGLDSEAIIVEDSIMNRKAVQYICEDDSTPGSSMGSRLNRIAYLEAGKKCVPVELRSEFRNKK